MVEMSNLTTIPMTVAATPAAMLAAERPQWFAIQTRAKHEKKIASELSMRGVTAFVPTMREIRRWSDRRKVIDAALFSCYAFVQAALSGELYLRVLQVPGVLRWVSFNGQPTSIPDAQIEAVRQIVNNSVACSPYPFLKAGDRVRIRGGCLEGVECVLVSDPSERRLVVSIESLQRSISIAADGYDLEPL
jgi:transcription antitermination factor NusG